LRQRSESFGFNLITGAKADLKEVVDLVDGVEFLHLLGVHVAAAERAETFGRKIGVVARVEKGTEAEALALPGELSE
jgi:hypothetical protein